MTPEPTPDEIVLTTGNKALDQFMESQLNFMTHLGSRIDMLTDAMDELRARFESPGGCGGFCNCFANDVNIK